MPRSTLPAWEKPWALGWTREQMATRIKKAKAADRELRSLGLRDNECGRLAANLERLLARWPAAYGRRPR